jgi:hypothetical protein
MGRAIVFHSPHLWDFAEEKNKFVPMAAQSARLVLTVFLISSSLLSMIELGHDVLHRFNNPFHQHRVPMKWRKASNPPTISSFYFSVSFTRSINNRSHARA